MHRQNEPLIIFFKDIWSLVFMNPQNMRPFYSLQLTMNLWRIGRNTQILYKVLFRWEKITVPTCSSFYLSFLKVTYLNKGLLYYSLFRGKITTMLKIKKSFKMLFVTHWKNLIRIIKKNWTDVCLLMLESLKDYENLQNWICLKTL